MNNPIELDPSRRIELDGQQSMFATPLEEKLREVGRSRMQESDVLARAADISERASIGLSMQAIVFASHMRAAGMPYDIAGVRKGRRKVDVPYWLVIDETDLTGRELNVSTLFGVKTSRSTLSHSSYASDLQLRHTYSDAETRQVYDELQHEFPYHDIDMSTRLTSVGVHSNGGLIAIKKHFVGDCPDEQELLGIDYSSAHIGDIASVVFDGNDPRKITDAFAARAAQAEAHYTERAEAKGYVGGDDPYRWRDHTHPLLRMFMLEKGPIV